jgi:ATP-dependent 26S proteasome regulatory subunit
MAINSLEKQIELYLDAQYPMIYLNTFEETKADEILGSLLQDKKVLEWNAFKGLVDFKTKTPLLTRYLPIEEALDSFLQEDFETTCLIIKDVHHYIHEPHAIALLKELATRIHNGVGNTVFLVSPVLKIPTELEKFISVFELEMLTVDEIKEIVKDFINTYDIESLEEDQLEVFSNAFKGLTQFEIIHILSLAYSQEGQLNKNTLSLILKEKFQVVKKSGIIEMVPLKEELSDVGGLVHLKEWLEKKAKIFQNIKKAQEFGVDLPKGVLIVGMPGCGKSLTAKATAQLFNIPLLRLDMGRLLGQYVGESEANMRKAIKLTEAISPCVLWIDEVEKAFAGINGSGGGGEVSTRLFGNFLTWMQEKTSPTFVIATANDIMNLPPELLRKGRFDEIFFVDFPNEKERESIFRIHVGKRRKQELSKIDFPSLVAKTKGYSGADIEGVVVEAIESAFYSNDLAVKTSHFEEIIKKTRSLSEVLKEKIDVMNKKLKDYHFKSAN